jgi:hypothetical protein
MQMLYSRKLYSHFYEYEFKTALSKTAVAFMINLNDPNYLKRTGV